MLLDHVTNQDKRSLPRSDRFHILLCQFNWQVHASINIFEQRLSGASGQAGRASSLRVPGICGPGTCDAIFRSGCAFRCLQNSLFFGVLQNLPKKYSKSTLGAPWAAQNRFVMNLASILASLLGPFFVNFSMFVENDESVLQVARAWALTQSIVWKTWFRQMRLKDSAGSFAIDLAE